MTNYASAMRNVYSQFGEDGVIEALLDALRERNEWCVEFGAWDGLNFSNCANLIRNRGYSAVMIEGSTERLRELEMNYVDNEGVIAINAMVGWGQNDSLDAILRSTECPADPDLVSIDIDGNDIHVWEAMHTTRPKIVCIEFNPTVPNAVDFAQSRDPSVQQGAGVAALVRVGREKGYEIVACTQMNALFVPREIFEQLHVPDNSLARLRPDDSLVTYLFVGYDGTVFLNGYRRMFWHHMPILDRRIQQIPRVFRTFYDEYSPTKQFLFRVWRRLIVRQPR